MKQDLQDRLATLRVEFDESVAERHLDAVFAELVTPSVEVRLQPTPRVRVATLLAAALLLVVPAAAFAAEGSVPGDFLYPVKRVTEQIRSIVDPNIEAEHRIEELESVVDRAAPFEEVSDRLNDAEESVADRDVPVDLSDRLDVVRDRIAIDFEGDRPPDGERATDERRRRGDTERPPPTTGAPQTTQPPTTTSPAPPSDRPPTTDATTTPPTTAPPDTDRPPRDGTTTTHGPPGDRDRPPGDRQG